MDKLYELKEMLCRELEKYAGKELSANNLEYVDKLAHAIKNIDKILEADEGSYEYRGSYRRGMSNRNYRDGSYEDGSFARRDSRGRYASDYSRHGDMIEELHELMNEAPENTKHEFRKFIQKIESM
jgi:hypothetical protein